MAISNNNHHALLLVSPGIGHIIPALELAKRLVTHKIISKLTFFYGSIKTSTPSKAETQILQSAIKENLFDLIQLPPIDLSIHVSPHDTLETKLAIIMHEIPLLFMSTISTMNLNPTMIITDFFFSQVIPLAKNLNLPKTNIPKLKTDSLKCYLVLTKFIPLNNKQTITSCWDEGMGFPSLLSLSESFRSSADFSLSTSFLGESSPTSSSFFKSSTLASDIAPSAHQIIAKLSLKRSSNNFRKNLTQINTKPTK